MKLKNKKTGEIAEFVVHKRVEDSEDGNKVYAQVVINPDEREDYEEPKEYWYINEFGTPTEITHTRENIYDKQRNNFGNYFESEEEAEKAVEKLKAWKRLKDKRFRFVSWEDKNNPDGSDYVINITAKFDGAIISDLNLLFGGEE